MNGGRALGRGRNRHGSGGAARKLILAAALKPLRLRRVPDLAAFHDQLLFLCAFADDARVRGAATRALERIAARVRGLPSVARAVLADSGIAGSVSRHSFEALIAAWLVARFAADVDIGWQNDHDSSGLDFLLAFLARRAEQDGLESPLLTTAWLRAAHGADGGTDLACC